MSAPPTSTPAAEATRADLREALDPAAVRRAILAAIPENVPLRGIISLRIMGAAVDQLFATIATLIAERDAANAELHAVDLAFEGLEETDRARRIGNWIGIAADAEARATAAEARERAAVALAERLTEALQDMVRWADAYPTSVFPPPDYPKAHAVLTAAGMTLDAISAAILRDATSRVGCLARAALTRSEPTTTTTEGDDHARA